MKKYFISLMFLGLLVVPGLVTAQTVNNQALIESLLKQITQLQAILIQLLNNQQVQPVPQPISTEWHRVQYGAAGASLNVPKDWKTALNNVGARGSRAADVGPVLSTYLGESQYLKCSETRPAAASVNGPDTSYSLVTLDGRTYCLATTGDVAAGTASRTYSYTTRFTNQVADRYITTKFTVYADNNAQTGKTFANVKELLNRIMSSATYTDPVTNSNPEVVVSVRTSLVQEVSDGVKRYTLNFGAGNDTNTALVKEWRISANCPSAVTEVTAPVTGELCDGQVHVQSGGNYNAANESTIKLTVYYPDPYKNADLQVTFKAVGENGKVLGEKVHIIPVHKG